MATYAAAPIDHTALGSAPRTPTSISSLPTDSIPLATSENPHLLRAHDSQKPDLTTSNISPVSDKTKLSQRTVPLTLTGKAAMAEVKRRKQQQAQNKTLGDSRQTSPNPAHEAMQSLMSVGGMSRPADAPAPDKLSEPLRQVAERITVPDGNSSMESAQVSPTSLGSFGLEQHSSGHSMTATANDTSTSGQQFVAEPAEMGSTPGYHENDGNLTVMEQDGNKAFSYPGPPPQEQTPEGGPSRGMSLPGYGQGSPKSPASNKKHKCPYCATDFTRHHNLKSHLLTHSQEKPYVCQTCQSRFRRLHDLKRHTKLHTGERPHTCNKCNRKFARGDALARHNKGPGGCAGRRSSFGGDNEFGDGGEDMDGVEYPDADGDDDVDPQGRRVSEPSRKRQHLETPHDPNREVYRQHSSTYPPVQHQRMRGNTTDMGPPNIVHPGSSNAPSPRDMSGHPSPAAGAMNSSYYSAGQVFAEPGMMTQSPKPLSPGQVADQHRLSVVDATAQGQLNRNRSTSLSTQMQQTHFGRGTQDGRTPPLPSTQFPSSSATQPGAHILPPLGASSQQAAQIRPGGIPAGSLPTSHTLHHHPNHPNVLPTNTNSQPGSLSSHGRSSGSSMRDLAGNEHVDIWAYARSIEQRFSRMQDEYELRLTRQQEEIFALKTQLGQLTGSYSSDIGRGPPPYPAA